MIQSCHLMKRKCTISDTVEPPVGGHCYWWLPPPPFTTQVMLYWFCNYNRWPPPFCKKWGPIKRGSLRNTSRCRWRNGGAWVGNQKNRTQWESVLYLTWANLPATHILRASNSSSVRSMRVRYPASTWPPTSDGSTILLSTIMYIIVIPTCNRKQIMRDMLLPTTYVVRRKVMFSPVFVHGSGMVYEPSDPLLPRPSQVGLV